MCEQTGIFSKYSFPKYLPIFYEPINEDGKFYWEVFVWILEQ
jgi:hypothetical protein